jgi:excisionase family DNA binding protein
MVSAVRYGCAEVVPPMQSGVLAHHDTAFQPQLGRSVTIDQAAQLLGMSRRTVYYRIREGRLRTIRTLGGSQRVLLESLVEQRQG